MNNVPLNRRERKKLQTRNAIIATAKKLFEQKGFQGVIIDEIAEAVDISRATFFNYFTSKDALLEAIAVEEAYDLVEMLQKPELINESVKSRIKHLLLKLTDDTVNYLHLTNTIILNAALNYKSVDPSDEEYNDGILYNIFAKEFDKGRKTGEVNSSLSNKELTAILFGSYYGVMSLQISDGNTDLTKERMCRVVDELLTQLF